MLTLRGADRFENADGELVEVEYGRSLVTRAGVQQSLRPQSFECLLRLLRKPQQLCTREELLEGVSTDDGLAHCIRDVRAALGDKNRTLLETRTGIGYILHVAPWEISAPQAANLSKSETAHIISASVLYAAIFALSLLIEIAYEFDKYGNLAAWLTPVVWTWIFVTTLASFAGLHATKGHRAMVRASCSFGIMTLAATSQWFLAQQFLPDTPVTMAGFQTLSAKAAYLKDSIYGIVVGLTFLTAPYLAVHLSEECGSRLSSILGDSRRRLLCGLLIWFGICLVGTLLGMSHLHDSLRPGPYLSLFQQLSWARWVVFFLFGAESVLWFGVQPTSTSGSEAEDKTNNPPQTHSGFRPGTLLLGGVILTAGLVAVILSFVPKTPIPHRCFVSDAGLHVVDSSGHRCWTKTFKNLTIRRYENTATGGQWSLIKDIDEDGHLEVLFSLYCEATEPREPGRLFCFSDVGVLKWTFLYGKRQFFGDKQVDESYDGYDLALTSADGRNLVIAVANHMRAALSRVVLLRAEDGTLVDEYFHPGWLYACALFDVDRDREPELVLGGINNPGPGYGHPALVVLNIPFSKKVGYISVEKSEVSTDFRDLTRGLELGYALFPKLTLFAVRQDCPFVSRIRVSRNEEIEATIFGLAGTAYFTFDRQLKLRRAHPGDTYFEEHTRLFREGRIDRELSETQLNKWTVRYFQTAPDGNSEEVHRLWHP